MISSFQLKFGRAPGVESEPIAAAPVNVFVGPNNSGKSRVLLELAHYCRHGRKDASALVLGHVSFSGFDSAGVDEAIEYIRQPPAPGETVPDDRVIVSRGILSSEQMRIAKLKALLQNPNDDVSRFCSVYLAARTLILNGSNRIGLVESQPAGNLQLPSGLSLKVHPFQGRWLVFLLEAQTRREWRARTIWRFVST